MGLLYGCAGRLTAKNGGFWPGQYAALLGAVANGGVWQGARVLSGASVEIIKERTGLDGGRQGRLRRGNSVILILQFSFVWRNPIE